MTSEQRQDKLVEDLRKFLNEYLSAAAAKHAAQERVNRARAEIDALLETVRGNTRDNEPR